MNSTITRATLNAALIPALALAAAILMTWPVWRWLWGEWMGNDYYSHGVLIPPVSLYLIYQRFRNDPTLAWSPGVGSYWGLVVTALGIVLYFYFFNNRAFYLAAFSTILLLVGLVWTLGGTSVARRLIFPMAYLLLMVPLPFVERTTLPLAMFTGVCSGGLAQFLGLDVQIVGNAVQLPNADLVIGAQCSGVNSLIALTALMCLVAYLVQGPIGNRILFVLLAIPLAIIGNILRVASLLFIARSWGAQTAFVFYHDYSGIAFFVIVLLLLWPIAKMLRCNQLRTEVI